MKIYNKIVLAWNDKTQTYDNVLFEDSFEYDGSVILAQNGEINIQYYFSEGWNFVSLPVNVEDNSVATIFPNAISAFSFDGNYHLETNLVNGEGYWIRFPDDGNTIISGTQISGFAARIK